MKHLKRENSCLITPPNEISNELCRLKTGLLRVLKQGKSRIIAFTSATRKEGNTTVLGHFGSHLARSGESVVLVDTNLRHPLLHKLFNMPERNGLSEIVMGEIKIEDCIRAVNGSLGLITSGEAHPQFAGDILESELFDDVLLDLSERFTWVLCDCAPAALYNDAAVLAPKLDGVILTVRAESTRWEVAEAAKRRLEQAGANIIGMVLNRRQMHIPDWLYYLLS